MTSRSRSPPRERPIEDALQPIITTQQTSTLGSVSQAIMAPFTSNQSRADHSTKILTGLAPVIMTPRMVQTAASSSRTNQPGRIMEARGLSNFNFSTLGRAPLRLAMKQPVTSQDLGILESTPDLLQTPIPEADGVAKEISLLKGFNATIPSSEKGKARRRQVRNVQFDDENEGEDSSHRKLGMQARGMLTEGAHNDEEHGTHGRKRRGAKRGDALTASKILGKEELSRQRREILQDKENLHVRRRLAQAEIDEITRKINSLDLIRSQLEQDLLRIQEEDLELEDELRGVQERAEFEEQQQGSTATFQPSRRRKGPAFLPSEHDDLPHGVAFMTLASHNAPITALDISEPYGLLVSASQDESTRLWDLSSGEEIAFLRGHTGIVKCLQVEGNLCVSGGTDNTVRVWDLRAVEDEEEALNQSFVGSLASSPRFNAPSIPDAEEEDDTAVLVERPKPAAPARPRGCLRTLEGHTKTVSSIYFEDACLVSGASDKTIRQWDINTGQCVLTMDILWALSHAASQPAPSTSPRGSTFSIPGLPGASLLSAASNSFSFPSPPMADGSWDMYLDFVGGVQFWGYALVSGSGDGAVRMWDMRTGQAHRTLVGHTAPVTCVQFDELHIVSGSLDKTIRIWDLRTGGIAETLRFDYPVTSLQFDSRKVVSCAGENGIKVYNRTTMQMSTLVTNGHTQPVERLRYMDRYLVSGARDSTVKVWAI